MKKVNHAKVLLFFALPDYYGFENKLKRMGDFSSDEEGKQHLNDKFEQSMR